MIPHNGAAIAAIEVNGTLAATDAAEFKSDRGATDRVILDARAMKEDVLVRIRLQMRGLFGLFGMSGYEAIEPRRVIRPPASFVPARAARCRSGDRTGG